MTIESVFGMSDEDFLKMNAPASPSSEEPSNKEEIEEEEAPVNPESDIVPGSEEGQEEEEVEDPPVDEGEPEEKKEEEVETTDDTPDEEGAEPSDDKAETDPVKPDDKERESGADKSKEAEASADKAQPTTEEYKAFYDEVMAPFKANGKTIQLKDPSEAVQLMKMGANYTWKMQSIAPHRKTLLMLENNNLLDEDKLSYLIDLDKKDPEAIKKLIKESGIDPLDIDTSAESTYKQGNHRVSEEHVRFVSTLEDLQSTPDGVATLQTINSWDQASKEELGKDPSIMTSIHQQRENGIYDQIVGEVERQRVLGKIPNNTPFIYAYQQVGNQLAQAGAFSNVAQSSAAKTPEQEQQAPAQPQGVRRVATPKPSVTNSDKAKAAATSRGANKSVAPAKINPLAMSDEEFLKQMDRRV